MKRQTQTILYHLLPVVFWLSAIGGSVLAYRQMSGYIVSIFALCAIHIIHRIPRWEEPVEQSFQVAVLLGIASYWLPSVLLLILPIWLYLMYRGLFGLRSVLATLIGLALVAIWAAVLYSLPFIFHLLPSLGALLCNRKRLGMDSRRRFLSSVYRFYHRTTKPACTLIPACGMK